MARLVEIWNAIIGVAVVKRFRNRGTAAIPSNESDNSRVRTLGPTRALYTALTGRNKRN